MKKILIGLLVCAWMLIAFLICRCDYLQTKYTVAQNNVEALNDTLLHEAIAYQEKIGQLELKNKALYDSLGVNKHTKEIVKVKVRVHSTDTLLIPITDTLLIRNFALDTVLADCYHSNHISMFAKSGYFSLSDSVSVKSELSYRVDTEKQLTKAYRTAFGRWLGRLTGHTVTVDKLYIIQKNPLIENDIEDYIQIIR